MNKKDLDYYLPKFLDFELRKNMNVSENTILSYKYAFISLFEFLKENYYLAGYISYQAKDVFLNRKISSKTPLLYFAAYKKSKKNIGVP